MTLGTFLIAASLVAGAFSILAGLASMRSTGSTNDLGHDPDAARRTRAGARMRIIAGFVLPPAMWLAVRFALGDLGNMPLF